MASRLWLKVTARLGLAGLLVAIVLLAIECDERSSEKHCAIIDLGGHAMIIEGLTNQAILGNPPGQSAWDLLRGWKDLAPWGTVSGIHVYREDWRTRYVIASIWVFVQCRGHAGVPYQEEREAAPEKVYVVVILNGRAYSPVKGSVSITFLRPMNSLRLGSERQFVEDITAKILKGELGQPFGSEVDPGSPHPVFNMRVYRSPRFSGSQPTLPLPPSN